MADTVLTPEEMKFFETGELQPGMTPTESAIETPEAKATAETDPAATTAAPTPPVNTEIADLLRQQLAEAHQRVGALEANIEQLKQPPKQPEPAAPDPTVDPLGAMMHQLESVNKQVAALQSALKQQQDQQTQLSNFQNFRNQVNSLRDEFVKTHSDFGDAYNHLRDGRIADLKAYGLTNDKIQQVIFQEEAALAESAIKLGRNPAEVVYEMAKRHGYTPKSTTASTTPASTDAKLNGIQQAQSAAKTLPSTPNVEEVSVASLKDASDDELNKIVQSDKLWAKITGADQHPI